MCVCLEQLEEVVKGEWLKGRETRAALVAEWRQATELQVPKTEKWSGQKEKWE